jgi:hypothetical protein
MSLTSTLFLGFRSQNEEVDRCQEKIGGCSLRGVTRKIRRGRRRRLQFGGSHV